MSDLQKIMVIAKLREDSPNRLNATDKDLGVAENGEKNQNV